MMVKGCSRRQRGDACMRAYSSLAKKRRILSSGRLAACSAVRKPRAVRRAISSFAHFLLPLKPVEPMPKKAILMPFFSQM